MPHGALQRGGAPRGIKPNLIAEKKAGPMPVAPVKPRRWVVAGHDNLIGIPEGMGLKTLEMAKVSP